MHTLRNISANIFTIENRINAVMPEHYHIDATQFRQGPKKIENIDAYVKYRIIPYVYFCITAMSSFRRVDF